MSDGGTQVTHEILYIPERPVPLLGRDLLSKLGAQVTFLPTKDPLFEWAQPLFLSVTPQDEWRLHNLPARKPEGLNSQERELTQQFPEVWAEAPPTPTPRLAKQAPLVVELKPGAIMSAPALGLPDLAKPFTLYVKGHVCDSLREKDKEAMGVLSQIMGTLDRPAT